MNERDVFINCPFSSDYDEHFQAITYAVFRSGFTPRCARRVTTAAKCGSTRFCRIIRESPYGIHDISKTEPDPNSGLPRFNMPFELGLYLGARTFGGPAQKRKKLLILDREPHRYQSFISDIGGQDIHAHGGEVSLNDPRSRHLATSRGA